MYTLVEICPECRSEDITVIDREFDRTSQCFRLEQADPKCNDNVPLDEIETFVNDVIKMAEQLVRKYNQE